MTSITIDTVATDKPTFHYHHTSLRHNPLWFQVYVNQYTIKEEIKRVTLPYRSAVKRGYIKNGVQFCCQQTCSTSQRGKMLWQYEATVIVNYIKAERAAGRDVVSVTHGYSHPLPDTVCTYIYERIKQ
jgi:hypothetical protein